MIVKVLRVKHSRSDNSFLFLKVRHFVNIVDASPPNLLLNYVSVSLIAAKDDCLHGDNENQEP